MQQRTEKVGAPKSIVRFKVEKKVCKTKFKNFAKKNMYVPDEYKKADGINEFRGIYLPYHRYEATLKVTMMHMERRRQLKRKRRRFIQLPDIGRLCTGSLAM